MPAAWDTSEAGLETVFFGRDTFLVHEGSYAVSVANTSSLYPCGTTGARPSSWGARPGARTWCSRCGRGTTACRARLLLLQAYRDTIGKMAKTWGSRATAPGDGSRSTSWTTRCSTWLEAPVLLEQETDWVRREVRLFVRPRST